MEHGKEDDEEKGQGKSSEDLFSLHKVAGHEGEARSSEGEEGKEVRVILKIQEGPQEERRKAQVLSKHLPVPES